LRDNTEQINAFKQFGIAATLLVLCFGAVFLQLFSYAAQESLHSHILLVPFVSAYLIWIARPSLPAAQRGRGMLPLLPAAIALSVLGAYFALRFSGTVFSHNDYLSINVFAFFLLLVSAAIHFLGPIFTKAVAFPLLFLVFLIPLPDGVTSALEIASQYASAETYSWFMDLSGATYFREGRTFVLPNLTIVVAQECSGIRSSFVLFITSLIAGHLFLNSTWKKVLLAFLVFPLGVLRNAFRIYLLSMLSAHWDPGIIHSPLHHRGGPIFFALSLIPFFFLLFWLKKTDQKKPPSLPSGALSAT
jgi:exosortase C (VPDSG-CTERM-specific)